MLGGGKITTCRNNVDSHLLYLVQLVHIALWSSFETRRAMIAASAIVTLLFILNVTFMPSSLPISSFFVLSLFHFT